MTSAGYRESLRRLCDRPTTGKGPITGTTPPADWVSDPQQINQPVGHPVAR